MPDTENRHSNRLIHETSPYLLQHAHNPVDWYPWGAEALNRAREEQKPILLSVGYSACHWCHVMERESFENEEIAALMNRHFVCIKVDREERPDIDHIYMTAVQMMTGQGGWPMTVFLTPDGKPFYGGTYFPPDDRYGRPGFPRILEAVAEAWEQRRGQVESQGEALALQVRQNSDLGLSPSPITPDLFDRAYQRIAASFDERFGGFGGAPKFPQPMILDFLMRYAHRSKRLEPMRLVDLTLEKMAFGGMYDQVGGGFHRYSTDAQWLVPHFEKMLYDNAQLAQAYLRAYQVTGDTLYRRICTETLDYVRREMTDPGGGFYSAQDADSEGEEGKFFVWSPPQVEEVLGAEDGALFCRFYDITERGNFEGHSIPNIQAPPEAFARTIGIDADTFWQRIEMLRRKLFEARERRVKPGRDEKVLTAWNGLMLAAFAEAAAVLDRADYRQTAVNNAEFVLRELYRDGRLLRTGKRAGETPVSEGGERGSDHLPLHSPEFRAARIAGFLEDYACYADGLLRLYEATFDRRWLDTAAELAETMVRLFADPNGGFFNTAEDAEALIDRPKDVMDNATPSGSSVAADVLLRLAAFTGRSEYRERAAAYLRGMAAALERHPQAFGRLLCAADFYVGPVQELAVIGSMDQLETEALLRTARAKYHPNLVVASSDPSASSEFRDLPLLENRPQLDGQPTAYLCENYACQQPTTDPAVLEAQLAA